MSDEPEEVALARKTLERKTGPQSHPTAQQLARAVIRWWESAMFWRDQAGALGPALLRANEELSRRRLNDAIASSPPGTTWHFPGHGPTCPCSTCKSR